MMEFDEEFMKHLEQEAEYGVDHSHINGRNDHCNAQRALRLIICAIAQRRGEQVGDPIGWAQPVASSEQTREHKQ